MRIIVVGGGILGLATARQLTSTLSDAQVTVLEKETVLASHQTGRNSGVVHAGLYYTPGSLKARLCGRGRLLLRDYCAAQNIKYEECGKVVVATEERELDPLKRLAERASANGVPGLRWLESSQVTDIEPHAIGLAGLHSPETAIVDYVAVAQAMARDVLSRGGEVLTSSPVARVTREASRTRVALASGATLEADQVIVCAGLQADQLARGSGEMSGPRIIPFRGEYFRLTPEREQLVLTAERDDPRPHLPGARSDAALPGCPPHAQVRRLRAAGSQRRDGDGAGGLSTGRGELGRSVSDADLAGNAAHDAPTLARRSR
jgi:L-2-hydroxyglutarate oxidase